MLPNCGSDQVSSSQSMSFVQAVDAYENSYAPGLGGGHLAVCGGTGGRLVAVDLRKIERARVFASPNRNQQAECFNHLGSTFFTWVIELLLPGASTTNTDSCFDAIAQAILVYLVYEKQGNLRIMMKMHGLNDAISYIYVFGLGLLGLFLFERFIEDVTFPRKWFLCMEIVPCFSLYRGLYELGQYSFEVDLIGTDTIGWKDILLNSDNNAMRDAVKESLKKVNLHDKEVADNLAGAYSGGMKRRLSVAISLIGNPHQEMEERRQSQSQSTVEGQSTSFNELDITQEVLGHRLGSATAFTIDASLADHFSKQCAYQSNPSVKILRLHFDITRFRFRLSPRIRCSRRSFRAPTTRGGTPHTQQNSCAQGDVHVTRICPWFFSFGFPHMGHGFFACNSNSPMLCDSAAFFVTHFTTVSQSTRRAPPRGSSNRSGASTRT
ncbi:ABC transporter A family member 6 [Acorus calamus]|uniref:ABC transporter A family member 6 n=1 Tax=Acorus calamus TaxID=4465 RepID=A0AAV9EES0_ACOCL|nr:ABC transporter A family member 6 [Acorus calamus]